MNTNKKSAISWLVLIALTVISAYADIMLELFNMQKSVFILIILFIVFLKGQQVVDIFMELKQAPKLWRRLLMSYVALLPLIIGLIYVL